MIRRLGHGDAEVVHAARDLFDNAPDLAATARFLAAGDHHLLVAFGDDERADGFVSGVETTHPDKGTEMLLYELSVAERARGRGIGRALVAALADLARERGCYGMWVLTDEDNAARATYRAAGGTESKTQVMVEWSF